MPIVNANGIALDYEDAGHGFPVMFCHELAADRRSWDGVFNAFKDSYRCVRYNARGYPPSSVPGALESYAHETLVADLRELMRQLEIECAYIVGAATGGGIALSLALENPDTVRGLFLIGPGAGSFNREAWLAGAQSLADDIRVRGIAALAESLATAPQRQALRENHPEAWDLFLVEVQGLDPVGCANMVENAMMRRPTIPDLIPRIERLPMPVFVAVGDQDSPALEACAAIARHAPFGTLSTYPHCGHTLPLEEPGKLAAELREFLSALDKGEWRGWTRPALPMAGV